MSDIINLMVYFDGTDNNKFRDSDPRYAYTSSETNIARLYEMAPTGEIGGATYSKFYVSGVGTAVSIDTEAGSRGVTDPNTLFEQTYSWGNRLDAATGGSAALRVAAAQARVDELVAANPDATIKVHVVGFSRGAGIGRDFVNAINATGGSRSRLVLSGFLTRWGRSHCPAMAAASTPRLATTLI